MEEDEKYESFRAKEFVRESIFKRGILRGVRLSLLTISRKKGCKNFKIRFLFPL